MKYVPRPYLFMGNRSLNGVQTKIHLLGYAEGSSLIASDTKRACDFAKDITGPSDCRFGFIIVHRTDGDVCVTSGRWSPDGDLQMEEAYANDDEHEEMQENYDGVQYLHVCEIRILAMENDAWIRWMIVGSEKPSSYLKSKMPDSEV